MIILKGQQLIDLIGILIANSNEINIQNWKERKRWSINNNNLRINRKKEKVKKR